MVEKDEERLESDWEARAILELALSSQELGSRDTGWAASGENVALSGSWLLRFMILLGRRKNPEADRPNALGPSEWEDELEALGPPEQIDLLFVSICFLFCQQRKKSCVAVVLFLPCVSRCPV